MSKTFRIICNAFGNLPERELFAVKYEPVGRAGSLNMLMQRLYAYRLTHDVVSICREDEVFRFVYGGWSFSSFTSAAAAAEACALPVTLIVLRSLGETGHSGEKLPFDLTGWQKLE